jgi:hypothetical protein
LEILPTHGSDGFGIEIDPMHIETRAQQINQITAISASGIHHPHPAGNPSLQELIEEIDIDVAKLIVEIAQ